MIKTKGVVERLEAAVAKASKAASCEAQVDILHDAILTEIKLVKQIQDMPGFRAWIEGERFALSQISARKK